MNTRFDPEDNSFEHMDNRFRLKADSFLTKVTNFEFKKISEFSENNRRVPRFSSETPTIGSFKRGKCVSLRSLVDFASFINF